ncbi:hypothetical protein [Methylobacterium aquaticum]|uniref:hypothetical protein n=1 Tax=Methylobacterium aquaticum TaxID=270351 RepID=UPI0019327D20|nr:hypothetical protein [Methylobacterium aquaticum]QRE73545.1 hypothetical protein F1D61_07865 [Methylobacterium aquaticum]
MGAAIGIRVYRVDFLTKSSREALPFDSDKLARHPQEFIKDFVDRHSTHIKDDQTERSWYFENKTNQFESNIKGYVRYGTFGFESNIVDSNTKRSNYKRKITDVEEIPLFFDFWTPKQSKFGLVAFQSFQGRSCIGLVMAKMRKDFEQENPRCLLNFRKLMPVDLEKSEFFNAPIKRFKLIKRKKSVDVADSYLKDRAGDNIDMELSIIARRQKNLGDLISLKNKMPKNGTGVIEYEGMEFNEAIAEVKFGKKTRRVGIFGYNSDAGVIDITDSLTKGADGHPTFDSIQRETTMLLTDFFKSMKGD